MEDAPVTSNNMPEPEPVEVAAEPPSGAALPSRGATVDGYTVTLNDGLRPGTAEELTQAGTSTGARQSAEPATGHEADSHQH